MVKKLAVLCSRHRSKKNANKRKAEIIKQGGKAHVSRIVGTQVYTTNVPPKDFKRFCRRRG